MSLQVIDSIIDTIVWRPYYPESIDNAALATTISELFVQFQYERLPDHSILLRNVLKPEIVLIVLLFYIVSKQPVAYIRTILNINSKSFVFRTVIAIHNLALALFSATVAWNTWLIVIQHYMKYGFMSIYCDTYDNNTDSTEQSSVSVSSSSLWHNGFGSWATIFYISKYYEFVDTWILVLKNKPASFLQVYHHTGIAFIMWAAICSQSNWLIFVVLFNSFIHTIMYTYFFIKTIAPTIQIHSAKYLTMAQIIQFFLGIACTIGIFILRYNCTTQSSILALTCLHLYGVGLITLFINFATRKYIKPKTN